jgi:hypothetical protein
VVQAAGLSKEQADQLTKNVEKWIADNFAVNISSDMIREKVFDELCQVNKNCANLFHWYEDNKYNKKSSS